MIKDALVAVAMVTAVGFAGCFGMCPRHYPGATWHEPGIYGELERLGSNGTPGPSLAFHHPGTIGHLSTVTLDMEREHAKAGSITRIALDPTPDGLYRSRPEVPIPGLTGPTVTATADNTTKPEAVRAAFTAFLLNVTSATSDQIDGWARSGANQSEDAGMIWYSEDDAGLQVLAFRVSVGGPFRLEALYSETGAGPTDSANTGFQWHSGGDWGFRFHFDKRTATLPNGVSVEADMRDIVDVYIRGYPETTNASLEKIKEGFRAVGIEVKGPNPDEFTMAQC